MIAATFDPAKELTLYFRVSRNGSLTFSFVDSDGNAYSLIYDDFELNIYKNQGDKKKLISLIVGSGISFPTSSSITVSITESQSNINEGEYYYELYRPDIGKTWLTGDAIFHNGKFDGVDNNATITITESGTPVTITISAGGGGDSEYSGDAPEESVGRLAVGTDISGLTANEILELILVGVWILSQGIWDDDGYWIDTKAWID